LRSNGLPTAAVKLEKWGTTPACYRLIFMCG